ncbi:MAG: hypothetical protein ACKV2T_22375 [Kofleriaceae bacterium]
MRSAFLFVLMLGVTGCKPDPNDEVCTHYAKLMVKCIEDRSENMTIVEDTAHNFCMKGMSGKHEQVFGARYKQMIECTRTAETCDALRKCEDPATP